MALGNSSGGCQDMSTEEYPGTWLKPFVFVLMPFAPAFNDIYEYGIKGGVQDAGAYAERIDEQMFVEGMLDRIFAQIIKADVVVADMTGRNPNVFYEVGYAHALNKVVVLLTQSADDIPFDLKHRAHIVYGGRISDLRPELTKRLTWAIRESRKRDNLVRNPRFKEGTKYWGTGYIESRITNGNWPHTSDEIGLPFVVSGGAVANGHRDPAVFKDDGWGSFSIDHQSPLGDHVWSSFSQLVAGLERDTDYVASYWVKAENLDVRTLFLTLDHQWRKVYRYYADPGTYEWRQVMSSPFNTGSRDFVDFRFVMQAQGKVWIDDVALYKRSKR
jgi:hypothetical protein